MSEKNKYFEWLESKGKMPKRGEGRMMSKGGLVHDRFHDSEAEPMHGDDHNYVQDSPYFDHEEGQSDADASYPHFSEGGMVGEDGDDDEYFSDGGRVMDRHLEKPHSENQKRKVSSLFASALARKMRY